MSHSATLTGFVGGGLAMGYLVAAVFFLRFWRSSREGLFLAFAAAFGLMSLAQVLPLLVGTGREWDGHVYLPRLAAFVTIIAAILIKNLPPRHPG